MWNQAPKSLLKYCMVADREPLECLQKKVKMIGHEHGMQLEGEFMVCLA